MRRSLTAVLLVALCAAQTPQSERARALLVAGKTEEALAAFREAAKQTPGDALALLGLAIAEYQTQRFSDSVQHAEAALRLSPNLSAANVFIGGGYLELGDLDKAVDPLRRAVVAMPSDRNAVSLFAQVHDALARRIATQIRATSPDSAAAYAVAGYSDLLRARFGPAFASFRRALEINPKLPGARAGLAEVYRVTGHADWANVEDRRETRAPGDDLYSQYLIHRRLARDTYDRLAQLPPSLELHLHRAQSFDASGSFTEAAAEWRGAVKLAPGNQRAQLGLAWSLFRRRDYDAVLPLVTAMLRRNPASLDANFLSGAALMNLENPDSALPFLRRAAAADEHFLPAHAALGQALLRNGNAAEAIPQLLAALPSDEDGSLHFQLARAYRLSGRSDLAQSAGVEYEKFRDDREQALARDERVAITAPVPEP